MKKQWEGLLEEKSFVRYTIYMYEVKKITHQVHDSTYRFKYTKKKTKSKYLLI